MDRRDYAALLTALPRRRDQLLPALRIAHAAQGWLPEDAIIAVSDLTAVPLSELYGIITSYSEFRLKPPHSPNIEVCTGLSCLMAGAQSLIEALPASAHAEQSACRFLCAVAPLAEIAGHYHGRLTPERFGALVAAGNGAE